MAAAWQQSARIVSICDASRAVRPIGKTAFVFFAFALTRSHWLEARNLSFRVERNLCSVFV